MLRVSVWAIVLATLSASAALAEDWPQVRGPTGQGLSDAENLPIEWTAERNVRWRVPIAGKGWSSPVYHDDRVYLTTAAPVSKDDASLSLRAICLLARDGTVVWDTEVLHQDKSAPGIHTKNSHASPTPLVHEGRLYVHFGHQGTACLDLQGNVLWRSTSVKYPPVHGNGGSPVLIGKSLIFSCDGGSDPFVVALNADTGDELWRTPRPKTDAKTFSFSTPLVIEVAGKTQVVSPASNSVCAYDPQDGRELWHVKYDGYSVIPRPVFGHGRIYLSTGYDSAKLLAIRVDQSSADKKEPAIDWTLERGAPNTPSPLLVGDELYVVSDKGIASCLDAKTGKPHWQNRIGGNYSASPVHAAGKIYFQSEEGVGTVIRAGKKFEKLATNKLDEPTLASYAVADGSLFIRGEKHLYRIEASSEQARR